MQLNFNNFLTLFFQLFVLVLKLALKISSRFTKRKDIIIKKSVLLSGQVPNDTTVKINNKLMLKIISLIKFFIKQIRSTI